MNSSRRLELKRGRAITFTWNLLMARAVKWIYRDSLAKVFFAFGMTTKFSKMCGWAIIAKSDGTMRSNCARIRFI